MTVPWHRINPFRFEELALEYARSEFPQHHWVPTPRTGDGNRDAEAFAHETVLNRVVEYQHWLEAKFHHKAGSPTRSQLDPTLVSGLIAPNVRAILFVTNGKISEAYILRAERAFSRPPERFVDFKDGNDLGHWLSQRTDISLRYFGKALRESKASRVARQEIACANILDIGDYRRALYKPISHLTLGRDYLLHLVFRSPTSEEGRLLLAESNPLTVSGPPQDARIQILSGTSSCCIRVTARSPGVFHGCAVVVGVDHKSLIRPLPTRLTVREDSQVSLLFAAQIKAAANIHQLMRSRSNGSNGILYLHGRGGVGKTYVLDSLSPDLDLQTDFLRISFSGQHAEDARLLCQLLLFLHFGPAGLSLNDMDISLIASARQVLFFGRPLLAALRRAIADGSEAENLIHELAANRDPRTASLPLVDPQPAVTSVVIVADDVHKLEGAQAGFLRRILLDHFNGRHNSFLLLTARDDEFQHAALKAIIRKHSIYIEELSPPSVEEVIESAQRILGRPCPHEFAVALTGVSYTTLSITNLLADLRRNRNNNLTEPAVIESLNRWIKAARLGKDKVVIEVLAKSTRLYPLLDIVHAVRVGVPLELLLETFSSRLVDTAAKRNLLRLDADSAVVPFHDLVYDAYVSQRGTCHTQSVGTLLAKHLKRGSISPDRALPALLRCGPSFEREYLEAATLYRNSFIDVSRFGPALEISRSIVAVYEQRKDDRRLEKMLSEAWFIYADCLNHCNTGDDAKYYFEKARGVLATKWSHPKGNGIHFEAEAELFNLSFWDLEVHRFYELRDFVERLGRLLSDHPDLLQERRIVRAYLTALNRLMMFSLLLDKSDNKLLQQNLLASDTFAAANYRAFAFIDYAKSNYHKDATGALQHLLNARKSLVKLGSEHRRELTVATEIAFVKCLAGYDSIADIVAAGRSLLDEGLWPEYLNARLKVVAALLSRQDGKAAAAEISEFYRRRPAIDQDPRRRFLLANIEAASAFLRGDRRAAMEWALEHQKLVADLGASYRSVAAANVTICDQPQRTRAIGWYQHGHKVATRQFLLEPRIW